jgi:simple sugar transport system permease protein
MNRLLARILPSIVALAAALAVSALAIALSGSSPTAAFAALIEGAFGSFDSLSETAVKSCPLLLTGLAITVAFQAGVWNIGAEGQLLMGALAMTFLGTRMGESLPRSVALPMALTGAAILGALWAGVAAQLKLRRGVNEVISTIMLNFIALGLISYLVQGPLMESTGSYPQSDTLSASFLLPRWSPYRVHLGLPLALGLAFVVHVLLFRSVAGYEIRASGLNPAAARLAGIDVPKRLLLALLISGALAGLAGGIEVSAVTRRLYERLSPGWGFTAIAVGLLGRLSPAGVVVAALFFGALDAGSNAMQRAAGVSSVLVSIIQATVILFLVALERQRWWPSTSGRSTAPEES